MHVDYSDDMHSNLTKSFLDENNVRFIVKVNEGTSRIGFTDRFNFLPTVKTEFENDKELIKLFSEICIRRRRNLEKSIQGHLC